MEFPTVSILVPAYNHEKFVEECLNSALTDPYPNKELVIIDDGSTDGTSQIISNWVARQAGIIPINFVSRPNKGVATTLNELASRAKGEFLRLGASDDYFLPGGLLAQAQYLMTHPHKLAVIGDSIVINETGETLYASGMIDLHHANKNNYRTDDGIRTEIISRWALGGPLAMIRNQTVLSIGGWSEDLRIDDWDFFLRLAAKGALGFIDIKVCAYRLHDKNTCRTDDIAERLANLGDAAKTAHKHVALFDDPWKSLLKAQCYLIAAKIGFLKRNIFTLTTNILRFALQSVVARNKLLRAAR